MKLDDLIKGEELDKYAYALQVRNLAPEPKYPVPKLMLTVHVFDKTDGSEVGQLKTSIKFSDEKSIVALYNAVGEAYFRYLCTVFKAAGITSLEAVKLKKDGIMQMLDFHINKIFDEEMR